MAHKVGAGSTKNGRDSNSKRLGLKILGFQKVKKGSIIIRQKGNKFKAGKNIKVGKDYTLYSLIDGIVLFNNNVINVK
jgi:large subunit ribosomal protein L27